MRTSSEIQEFKDFRFPLITYFVLRVTQRTIRRKKMCTCVHVHIGEIQPHPSQLCCYRCWQQLPCHSACPHSGFLSTAASQKQHSKGLGAQLRHKMQHSDITIKLKCLGLAAKQIKQLYFKLIIDQYSPKIINQLKLSWPSLGTVGKGHICNRTELGVQLNSCVFSNTYKCL